MFKRKKRSARSQAQVSKPGRARFLNEYGVVWSWIANPVCYTLESSNGLMISMGSEILSLSAISPSDITNLHHQCQIFCWVSFPILYP